MEVLSFFILILLSLFAYSAGTASQMGHLADMKPQIMDLLLVLMIWTGAIYSRIALELNKWLLILIWIVIGFLIGSLVTLLRKDHMVQGAKRGQTDKLFQGPIKKFWYSWKHFSRRTGSFQSKVLLSLFFFLWVTPFALAVKMFSDPLRLKPEGGESHWLMKKEILSDLAHLRRQF